MTIIDTHTHLYLGAFKDDRDAVVQRAIDKGVTYMLLPNIDSSSIEGMMRLRMKYPDHCFPMMGLHPTSVKENYKEELEVIDNWLAKSRFIAVGECGIDLYWDKAFFKEQQIAFKHQIELAKKYELPIVIHSRDSFDEIFEILNEANDERLKGVFHCFTGSSEQAAKILDYGDFYLGIGGVLTFKKAGLDMVMRDIDLEHIILETDAPFLTPMPYRGKRNESAYTYFVAQKLAQIKNISIKEVADITTANAKKLFSL